MASVEQIIKRQIRQWDRVAATLGYQPGAEAEAAPTQAEVSKRPVICISRQLGSGAGEVVEALSAEIGYEILGRDIIDHIAEDMNVQRRIIDDRDERLHSSITSMVDSFLRGRDIDRQSYLRSLVRVIGGVAQRGGVILLGRGAVQILGSRAPIRVRLTAPIGVRVRRLSEKHGIGEEEARDMAETSDRERRAFLRHFFQADADDLDDVDLLLNTARIEPAACAGVILSALRARGFEIDLSEAE